MLGFTDSIAAVASLLERVIDWADKDPETLRQIKLLHAKDDLLKAKERIQKLLDQIKEND